MGCISFLCHILFIVSALFTGLVSYYLYQVVPENVENPWLVSAWLGARQFIHHVSLMEEKLGVDDRLIVSRQIYDVIDVYQMKHETEMTDLKVSTTLFGEIRVRLYEPTSRKDEGPAILYFHGGGWTTGSIDSVNTICRTLASKSKMLVVAVSFSLAPEDPYPQALDDCENATRYFMENSQRYNVDPDRIALAGDDTGANLAAALTLRGRDRHWKHQPKLQILIYPILQIFDFNTPSYVQNRQILTPLNNAVQIAKNSLLYIKQNPNYARTLVHNKHTSQEARTQYGNLISHHLIADKYRKGYEPIAELDYDSHVWQTLATYVLHPHVAPLMYGNGKLQKIAKAYIVTMEHDSLRDDGMIYARRLRQSGVKALLKHYDDGYHDSLRLLGYTRLAERVIDDLVKFLEKDL